MNNKKNSRSAVNLLALKVMQSVNAKKEDHNYTLNLLTELQSAIQHVQSHMQNQA